MCVSLSQLNGQTYKLEFWHVGQGRRSKVKITRSKTFLIVISKNSRWDFCLRKDMGLWMDLPRIPRWNINARPTALGVLKVYAVFPPPLPFY